MWGGGGGGNGVTWKVREAEKRIGNGKKKSKRQMRWLLVKAGKRSPAHRLSAPRKHIRLVELITCSLRLSSPNTILGHTCLLAQILPHNCHRGAGTCTFHVLHQQGAGVYAAFAGACRPGWTAPNKRLSCGPTASALGRDVGILGAKTQQRGGNRVKTEMWEGGPIRV